MRCSAKYQKQGTTHASANFPVNAGLFSFFPPLGKTPHRVPTEMTANEHAKQAASPFHAVQVRSAVVSSHSIEQVVQHCHAHATPTLAHGRHQAPVPRLRAVALHGADRVTAAPACDVTKALLPLRFLSDFRFHSLGVERRACFRLCW